MTSQTKLGLYVSDSCRKAVPKGKGWFEFRSFVKTFWQPLLMQRLLVPESAAGILEEVAVDLKSSCGIKPQWNIDETFQNSRILVNRLVAASKGEVDRILLFLDPYKLEEEVESLWVLREAVAEHGQKLNINLGARLWMERQLGLDQGIPSKPFIGTDDAFVLVGQNPGLAIDRFGLKHVEKMCLFPRLILPRNVQVAVAEYLRAAKTSAYLRNASTDGMEDITKLLVKDYFNTRQRKIEDKIAHVVALPDESHDRHVNAMEQLISICADPRMQVNLMLNQATAEEWIQQPFEHTNLQPLV